MNLYDFLLGGGGIIVILLTIVELSPIKVDPWSAIAKAIGRAINSDVLDELKTVKKNQERTQQKLEEHIQVDDERNADSHRQRILQFNNELLRDIPHTREDFIEILTEIDFYETYCREHKDYKNSRCAHAIANISRVYDERLKKHDFLPQ